MNDVVEYIKKVKMNQPKFLSNVPKVCGISDMEGIKDFRRILFKLTQVFSSYNFYFHRVLEVHDRVQ